MKKTIVLFCAIIAFFQATLASGKKTIKDKFEHSYSYTSKDTSFHFTFGGRLQQRFEVTDPIGSKGATDEFLLRRARLKSHGHLFSKKLGYYYQQDLLLDKDVIMDLILKYKIKDNLEIIFGRTKLPNPISNLMSSQKISFPERSAFHHVFSVDRAEGLQLKHTFKIGGMVVAEHFAISDEHLIKNLGKVNKFDYTGRVQVFPFGEFSNGKYHIGADLEREKTGKLMLGVVYDYNFNAANTHGRDGLHQTNPTGDVSTLYFDGEFKYKGLSVMSQYANTDLARGHAGHYDLGDGFMTKVSYTNKRFIEFMTRYSDVHAIDLRQYSMGITKYIVGNNLKVNYSFDYNNYTNNQADFNLHTFQLEVLF